MKNGVQFANLHSGHIGLNMAVCRAIDNIREKDRNVFFLRMSNSEKSSFSFGLVDFSIRNWYVSGFFFLQMATG